MTEVSSTSTAIKEDDGESEDAHEEGGRWQETRSQTISLVARMSSTCERVTGEGSGFRGAIGTGGKPSIGVHEATNSGDTCEDPRLLEGVRAKKGERAGGGVARASGHLAAKSHSRALKCSQIFGSMGARGGRGGQEEEEETGGPDLRRGPQDQTAFFLIEKNDPDP
jgi:hypothetical protein